MKGWESLGFKSYKDYLNSDIWKDRKEQMLNLEKRCKKCNSKYLLQVHHISYERVCNETKKDLIVLCKSCHEKEHNKEDD